MSLLQCLLQLLLSWAEATRHTGPLLGRNAVGTQLSTSFSPLSPSASCKALCSQTLLVTVFESSFFVCFLGVSFCLIECAPHCHNFLFLGYCMESGFPQVINWCFLFPHDLNYCVTVTIFLGSTCPLPRVPFALLEQSGCCCLGDIKNVGASILLSLPKQWELTMVHILALSPSSHLAGLCSLFCSSCLSV